MNQTAGAILRRKVSAIQTRGYSFPIQSELAAKLEYAGEILRWFEPNYLNYLENKWFFGDSLPGNSPLNPRIVRQFVNMPSVWPPISEGKEA